jgi:hypothetical protein
LKQLQLIQILRINAASAGRRRDIAARPARVNRDGGGQNTSKAASGKVDAAFDV